ncbi:hypothetical protein TcBrA4_0092650 [Trypanosoma cruzi]|nr:hypothetical protein TcBrA4_0092650 [Trypanosoma cruzi]
MPAASGASGRCVHGGGAGVLTAELLELSVKAASQQARKPEAPDAPHGDACRAPRRRPRHAPEECDAVGGGVIPSLNKAVAKKHKSSKKARATPSA